MIDTFQQSFAPLREKNIVLYGIGKNTEAVLNGTEGFSFVGLMDQNTTGQTIFQQKVLSDEEVIALHPMIVIIARESVVNIIFKRIQYLNVEHGIEIYDFQGNLLGQESLAYRNQDLPYWNASAEQLWEQIRNHDIISFDIFDTLLMRKALLPEDVFLLTEKRIANTARFAAIRQQAEKSLHCPDLDEIYEKIREITGWDSAAVERMKKLECEVDASLLMPRGEMCEIFREAVAAGKEVYLISDMYYPKAHLEKLLSRNGIEGYRDLFVSCEVKKEKSDGGLFRWFVECVGEGRKLHIGDNRRADIQKALENGLDAYHIYSGYELLMASSMQGILSDVRTLAQRCMLGMVAAKLFANPFVLGADRGYVHICDVEKLGYCFVAPMLTEFVKWFMEQVRERGTEQVLFPSRDGYLIQKVYEAMGGAVESVYFRTSRRAASVAGIRDKDDIRRIASRKYNGNYGNYLLSRFGVEMKKTDQRRELPVQDTGDEETCGVIRDYEAAILQQAHIERENYLAYLDKKGILAQKKQVLFDFVAGGTVQYNLEKLLQREMTGIYFATMNLPNQMYGVDTDKIDTAYGNIQSYGTHNMLGKYYLFLETILIDDRESLSHIDENGQEIFESGSAKGNFAEIEKLQAAVLEYVREYEDCFRACFGWGSAKDTGPELEFADGLFGVLFSRQCIVEEQVKAVFQNDDVYDGIGVYRLWND